MGNYQGIPLMHEFSHQYSCWTGFAAGDDNTEKSTFHFDSESSDRTENVSVD